MFENVGERGDMKRSDKVIFTLFISWMIFMFVGIGLIGNAYLVFKLLNAGHIVPAIGSMICFGAGCFYTHRL